MTSNAPQIHWEQNPDGTYRGILALTPYGADLYEDQSGQIYQLGSMGTLTFCEVINR